MTIEEFDKRRTELYAEYETKRKNLYKEYAASNARAKMGDIITDKFGVSIVVNDIDISDFYNSKFHYIYYHGTKLNKDGQPDKNGCTETVYDEYLTSINGNTIIN